MGFCGDTPITMDLLSIISMATIFSFIGVMYLVLVNYVSTILRLERAGETFSMEMKSLLAGAVLVLFILFLVVPLFAAINDLHAYGSISSFLADMQEAVLAISEFAATAHDLSPFGASFSVSYLVKGGYSSSGSLSALGVVFSTLSREAATILNYWSITKATYDLTCFFMEIAAKFLLPAGLLLRFLPPMKRVGSTLISISLGLLVALPLSFYISNQLANELLPTSNALSSVKIATNSALGKVSGLVAALKAYEVTFFVSSLVAAAVSAPGGPGISPAIAYTATAVGKGVQLAVLTPINIKAETMLSQGFINAVLSPVVETADFAILSAVRVVFTSFIIAFSTLGFIRSLALILGGEFFLYGIQRRI